MVAEVHIQFLPKALSGILRGYLIASIVVSVRNTEFETLILNLRLPQWAHTDRICGPFLVTFRVRLGAVSDTPEEQCSLSWLSLHFMPQGRQVSHG